MIRNGVYPTVITPYKDGEIDYAMLEILIRRFADSGCHGIFAVCQSSEMAFLSLRERCELARRSVEFADGRLSVVVSGHCASDTDAQAEEICAISACGADAFVLVSNRLDLHNDGDDVWLENAQKLLEKLDGQLKLGIYECPAPYKRLLSPRILEWCKQSGRFSFIKDTCCCPDMLARRLEILAGSSVKLFNANGQTLLHSLQHGAAGYSGIMANFFPELWVWLYEHFSTAPEKAQVIADFLSMMACTESGAYPATAKYYLQLEGLPIGLYSRSCDQRRLTPYQKHLMEQLHRQSRVLRGMIGG